MKLFNQAAKTPLYPACPTLTILCFVEGGVHDVPKSVGAANRLSWRVDGVGSMALHAFSMID